jgi:hypothetical protein
LKTNEWFFYKVDEHVDEEEEELDDGQLGVHGLHGLQSDEDEDDGHDEEDGGQDDEEDHHLHLRRVENQMPAATANPTINTIKMSINPPINREDIPVSPIPIPTPMDADAPSLGGVHSGSDGSAITNCGSALDIIICQFLFSYSYKSRQKSSSFGSR